MSRHANSESLWVRFLRWLMPANGLHAKASETGELPVYEDDDAESYPVTCANGCPEGYLGWHKFSCDEARPRETRYDLPIVRPYMNKAD